MLLYETVAISLADAVSGMAIEISTRPAACRYPNYGSGLENKFCAEVLKGSAGTKRSEANEIMRVILPKYEDKLKSPPRGKSFPECTNLKTLKPTGSGRRFTIGCGRSWRIWGYIVRYNFSVTKILWHISAIELI